MLLYNLALDELQLKYSVRDPIHGFVHFNELEKAVIDHPIFQRLRHIHQLAFTNLVYPAAGHTRFEHSIGVMEVATRMFLRILSKCRNDILELYEEQTLPESRFNPEALRSLQILRLACLLHDCGHAPFSHGPEALFPIVDGLQQNHEHYSVKLTHTLADLIAESRCNTGLADRTKTEPIAAAEVASLISGDGASAGNNQFWSLSRSILSGQLDADRMDYLLRDSYHVGVDYGRFDLERTIESLTICLAPIIRPEDSPSKDLILAIEKEDWLAAESVVLARRAMFRQVYLHKTRRVFDLMLILAMRRILPGGCFPPPDQLDDYLHLTDFTILTHIANYSETMSLRDALLNRDFPRRSGSLVGDEPLQHVGQLRNLLESAGYNLFTDSELMTNADLDALEAPESVWMDTGATFKTYKNDPTQEIRLRDSQTNDDDIDVRLTGTRLSKTATGLSLGEALQMSSYRIYCREPIRQKVAKVVLEIGGRL